MMVSNEACWQAALQVFGLSVMDAPIAVIHTTHPSDKKYLPSQVHFYMYVCMHAYMYVLACAVTLIYVHMHIQRYLRCACVQKCIDEMYICTLISRCLFVCMYIIFCMCVCVYYSNIEFHGD
jgi:hypothetical protein